MPTRNINLTDHYDALLSQLMESGRFKNASEAVRAGLRLLERQEQEDEARLAALRRDVEMGVEAYRRGDYVMADGDDALDELFDELAVEAERR